MGRISPDLGFASDVDGLNAVFADAIELRVRAAADEEAREGAGALAEMVDEGSGENISCGEELDESSPCSFLKVSIRARAGCDISNIIASALGDSFLSERAFQEFWSSCFLLLNLTQYAVCPFHGRSRR